MEVVRRVDTQTWVGPDASGSPTQPPTSIDALPTDSDSTLPRGCASGTATSRHPTVASAPRPRFCAVAHTRCVPATIGMSPANPCSAPDDGYAFATSGRFDDAASVP